MARNTKVIQITSQGRDRGKTFVLKEMPADQAERWAFRMLLALASGGSKIPDGALESGMAGLAVTMPAFIAVGLRSLAGLKYEDVRPLLDEMMECVQYQPPNGLPAQDLLDGEYGQIEEVSTRLQLRYEVLQLHVGFSLAGNESTTGTTPAA